jgi:hypothetical protein
MSEALILNSLELINEPLPFIPCTNIQTALFYVNNVENVECWELNTEENRKKWEAAKWFVVLTDGNIN